MRVRPRRCIGDSASEALCGAPKGPSTPRRRKFIHTFFALIAGHLDTKQRLKQVPKARFVRALTSVKTPCFIGF
jgi:hypothetical protein